MENINKIDKIKKIKTKQGDLLLHQGLQLATSLYGVGKDFAAGIYMREVQDDMQVVVNILDGYGCFFNDEYGDLCVDLTKLADPSLVRPCSRLMELFLENGQKEPALIFKEIETSPSAFNKMVYTYRMVYDALFFHSLPHIDRDQRIHFLENTSLTQIYHESIR